MTSNEARRHLLDYLGSIARPGRSLEELADDDNLFDAGILDSLAVIQIIVFLEQEHGVDLAARRISPEELGTIGGILRALEPARA